MDRDAKRRSISYHSFSLSSSSSYFIIWLNRL
jgi:hypothetical protein